MLSVVSHRPSPDSDFYTCAFMWERMCVELRKLERGDERGGKRLSKVRESDDGTHVA